MAVPTQTAPHRQFSYDVSFDDSTGQIHIVADGKVPIGINFSWSILTDSQVLEAAAANFNNISKANSLNKFLGITTANSFQPDDPGPFPGFV